MSSNDILLAQNTETHADVQAIQFSLGLNFYDLVRFDFLEQSARYLGAYCNPDTSSTQDTDDFFLN